MKKELKKFKVLPKDHHNQYTIYLAYYLFLVSSTGSGTRHSLFRVGSKSDYVRVLKWKGRGFLFTAPPGSLNHEPQVTGRQVPWFHFNFPVKSSFKWFPGGLCSWAVQLLPCDSLSVLPLTLSSSPLTPHSMCCFIPKGSYLPI